MFEGVVAGILNRLLGKYIQDLDTENLNVGIFSGNVNLTDLKLKPEALYELDLPIDVKIGTIGRINLQIPWSGLYTQPVVATFEDVLILVGPAISNTYFDPEREKRLMRAAKRKILQDLEAESEILSGPQNFFEQLFTDVINNIHIYIRNVHIRYEDSISSKDGPLACGLCLQSLSIETTNSKWKPALSAASAATVYEAVRVDSLALYWNAAATVLDDAETAHITPMQYYNWKHYMITGLDKFSMYREDFEFLLKPTTCKVKVIISRRGEARTPRLLADAVVADSALQLSRRQYLSVANLARSFQRIALNRKYRHLHPGVCVANNARRWWEYAYGAVVEQRVRPYTWRAVRRHRGHYHRYKQTYKSTLRSPNDTELKLDLQQCEDNLPLVSVVIAREHAKIELLSSEPERIAVVESEFDWWKAPAEGEGDSRARLCVSGTRTKTLWSQLSSPEKKRLCELIGYAEGSPLHDRPKQYIEHKLNLTLANCSLNLLNRKQEVLVVTVTQFLASVETRPSAKAYKVSVRAEILMVEGAGGAGELVPLLVAECGPPKDTPSNTTVNFLSLDYEKNPLNIEADYGLTCTLEPMEIIYNEHSCTELINFFQTHSMSAEELSSGVAQGLERASRISKSVLAYAVSRKKVFNLCIDIKGPCLVVPELGCFQKPGKLLVIDVGRAVLKSDLQPSNITLEDATCMELEEKLYDRIHAEFTCQILFCDSGDPWRESKKHADSQKHLVPKIKTQIVFSNSIKKDYKLLPRYKLNISISSLKLNVSDRAINSVLEFCEGVPAPRPTTVPVSYLDSADYPEEAALGARGDVVRPDPDYRQLVDLTHLIVSTHLQRNRRAESAYDKSPEAAAAGGASGAAGAAGGAGALPELSDEEAEVYARSVDLPGFEDNVSPSNTINVLLRFVIGEMVINLSRSLDQTERPYIMVSVGKACLDVALLAFGPAAQLTVRGVLVADKQQHSDTGQYLEMVASDPHSELLNLIYRKVRADCPEFATQFHGVEQALVADVGALALVLHADAARTLTKYLQYVAHKIQKRHMVHVQEFFVPKSKSFWERLTAAEDDPPVPPGATKFSYSVRASALSLRLCQSWPEGAPLELRLAGLESDCVFRANDRVTFRLFLNSFNVDDLSDMTLYPKLVWLDEDKVLELKYVRHAPRLYAQQAAAAAAAAAAAPPAPHLKADGSLRLYVGKLHVVLLYKILGDLQQFVEPLVSAWAAGGVPAGAARGARRAGQRAARAVRGRARLALAVEVHAPALLLPQKPSSPNLLLLNMDLATFESGDLLVENFFKELTSEQEARSPVQSPVIDNVLVKLTNVTLSRAVMTLAGSLQVQEPILEPASLRCDLKRAVGGAAHDLPLWEADLLVDTVSVNLGQKDLATMLAVWHDNFSESQYIGSVGAAPSSPVDPSQADTSVNKLQAFFAMAEPTKKEAELRLVVEGVEVKLFSDMEEVLSSPVRDPGHGLARLRAGELGAHLVLAADGAAQLRASLDSLLVEDIRHDPAAVVKRIFQSSGGSTRAKDGIEVCSPPVVDVRFSQNATRDRTLDVRVERSRLNLCVPFVMQLARALLDALPGDKTIDGGVVNHGYVSEVRPAVPPTARPGRPPNSTESTSGYYSTATSLREDSPGLSISIQFQKPEIMFFTDLTKTESHALLVRTELLIDYSYHSNTENTVISLAGLRIVSKLQSKLENGPPQTVLQPCDVEFSRIFKDPGEEVKVRVSASSVSLHVSPTTVHAVTDMVNEIVAELAAPEDKERFNFTKYQPKTEKEEDLWSPKKVVPYASCVAPEETYEQPAYPRVRPRETLALSVPAVRVTFEVEHGTRTALLMLQASLEAEVQEWWGRAHGQAAVGLLVSAYDEGLQAWAPLLEPVHRHDHTCVPPTLTIKLFQAKAYPMSAKLIKDEPLERETTADGGGGAGRPKPRARRPGAESETSADDTDTDNEMTFIRSPRGREGPAAALATPHMLHLADESDSEHEGGPADRLAAAIAHLFTDDSSADDGSDDDSSGGNGGGEGDPAEGGEGGTAVAPPPRKTDTVQDGGAAADSGDSTDSADSGLESERCADKTATYVVLEALDVLQLTASEAAVRALAALHEAWVERLPRAAPRADAHLQLLNDIGPGSTVHLVTRAETDLAGNDRVLAVADYDLADSRPSTPGDVADDPLPPPPTAAAPHGPPDDPWDCFEGGFSAEGEADAAEAAECASTPLRSPTLSPAADRVAALYRKLTDQRLLIKLHDQDELAVPCPQRSWRRLYPLQPAPPPTRYCLVVERTSRTDRHRVVVRSPLQIRNETCYALEVSYRRGELAAAAGRAAHPPGDLTNPFEQRLRVATVAPHDTYNVPLLVAYHCRLHLLPANFETYLTPSQGIWWMDLSKDLGTPRDIICTAKADEDHRIFAMRILTEEGCKANKISRSIPNYLIRVVPPLALYNRLPYAVEVAAPALDLRARLEAGERTSCYTADLARAHDLRLELAYRGLTWTGTFALGPAFSEKSLTLTADGDADARDARLCVCVKLQRDESWDLFLYAPYWIINKTGLPMQIKGCRQEAVFEVSEEPAMWGPGARRWWRGAGGAGAARVRLRVHHSEWSRAFTLTAGTPGLVVCRHRERDRIYRIFLQVSLSELCPQLTKIVTLSPYFLVHNATKRPLRFMEENEAADLWLDLAPAQCVPFWPLTASMALHCKYRDSPLVSHHFPILPDHFTVLRMDKGSALSVTVSGGVDAPCAVTFRAYAPGDAPVRLDNFCDDLFLKLHQQDSSQVALLSPAQSLLYTWDDPTRPRTLLWNVYNNKGNDFVADFSQDGYGEEKVSVHTLKQSSVATASSVTSKLSSTLKRLTPVTSPPPPAPPAPPATPPARRASSSSDDSDSSGSGRTPRRTRRDRVVVYWVSFMDGHQRVLTFATDERIAHRYRMQIKAERSDYEIYASLAGIGLSVCTRGARGPQELAYASAADAPARWELLVSGKWKALAPELAAWFEDHHRTGRADARLRDSIHVDFQKMQMTKPFFSELRRTYEPAVWVQFRKSETYSYWHAKVHRLQLDNQLHDAVFPCVLFPAPGAGPRPGLELVAMKRHRAVFDRDDYKYVKVLVQEYCVNLDRGFVNYVFDILNRWRVEEKPAVRLRTDLALVHMPLPVIAQKSQSNAQKNVVFEYVYLSPICISLSLSSRGHDADLASGGAPGGSFGCDETDRPKLFNSDLLEFLFNSWGSFLCDMKDVKIRTTYLEVKNEPVSEGGLWERARRHYWTQLLQQFYVLVLGLDVLGNPYGTATAFCRGLQQHYHPSQSTLCSRDAQNVAFRLGGAVAALLGQCAGPPRAPRLPRPPRVDYPRRKTEGVRACTGAGGAGVAGGRTADAALALAGLLATPAFGVWRWVTGAGAGADEPWCPVWAARAAAERAGGGRLVLRRRLPRHCSPLEGLGPYCCAAALGERLARAARGPVADGRYVAHCTLAVPQRTLLITDRHVAVVRRARSGGGAAGCAVEWSAALHEIVGEPALLRNTLVLSVRQNESANYVSTDEKVLELVDAESARWAHAQLGCALALAAAERPLAPPPAAQGPAHTTA